MECKFYIGQKVVCITNGTWVLQDRDGKIIPHTYNVPIKGEIYTIRSLEYVDKLPIPNSFTLVGVHVRLVEIVNDPIPTVYEGVKEIQFFHTEFKPLEEKKTDISIFTDMLIKQPEKVD